MKVVPSAVPIPKIKKEPSTFVRSTSLPRSSVSSSTSVKTNVVSHNKGASIATKDRPIETIIPPLVPCRKDNSPSRSDGGSVSMDESMSTCDSLKSSDIEYVDNIDPLVVDSIERKAGNNFHISKHIEAENLCKPDIFVKLGPDDKIVDIDGNHEDPQFCTTIACDIYENLRASEVMISTFHIVHIGKLLLIATSMIYEVKFLAAYIIYLISTLCLCFVILGKCHISEACLRS